MTHAHTHIQTVARLHTERCTVNHEQKNHRWRRLCRRHKLKWLSTGVNISIPLPSLSSVNSVEGACIVVTATYHINSKLSNKFSTPLITFHVTRTAPVNCCMLSFGRQ